MYIYDTEGSLVKAAFDLLRATGIVFMERSDGGRLHLVQLDGDETGVYETYSGWMLDDGEDMVKVPASKLEKLLDEKTDGDLRQGWFCRWIRPWVRKSYGPWVGPLETEADILTHVRGEYE